MSSKLPVCMCALYFASDRVACLSCCNFDLVICAWPQRPGGVLRNTAPFGAALPQKQRCAAASPSRFLLRALCVSCGLLFFDPRFQSPGPIDSYRQFLRSRFGLRASASVSVSVLVSGSVPIMVSASRFWSLGLGLGLGLSAVSAGSSGGCAVGVAHAQVSSASSRNAGGGCVLWRWLRRVALRRTPVYRP